MTGNKDLYINVDMDVEDGVENDSLRFTALNKKKDSHKSPGKKRV